jgi:hypothetical protein
VQVIGEAVICVLHAAERAVGILQARWRDEVGLTMN